MKKSLLIMLLSLTMVTGLLAGCGAKEEADPEPDTPVVEDVDVEDVEDDASNPDPVELTLWVTSRNADDWSEAMEEKFLEEHPWITLNKVVKEGDPGNEFYQGVASGTAPDLVDASFAMLDTFMTAGIVEPLNRYVDEWDEWANFTTEYTDMFNVDGNVYAIPKEVAPMLFGYNKALF